MLGFLSKYISLVFLVPIATQMSEIHHKRTTGTPPLVEPHQQCSVDVFQTNTNFEKIRHQIFPYSVSVLHQPTKTHANTNTDHSTQSLQQKKRWSNPSKLTTRTVHSNTVPEENTLREQALSNYADTRRCHVRPAIRRFAPQTKRRDQRQKKIF